MIANLLAKHIGWLATPTGSQARRGKEQREVSLPKDAWVFIQDGVAARLLPTASFYLGAAFAPARQMVEAGVPVAMASDCNPGSCPCLNLQFVMNPGCLTYKLAPEEALTTVTLNAAAIGRADTVGSLEPGKRAGLLIWDAPDLDYICRRMGSNLVDTVVKKGAVVSPTPDMKSAASRLRSRRFVCLFRFTCETPVLGGQVFPKYARTSPT